jgi:phenylacetyl-CoA:acceptor oxidoreductase subunit 2
MSYGPDPWQQTVWDRRAAGNFIGGGVGSGLIVFAALSTALGRPVPAAFAGGAALVALGLLSVWFEIGRPLRALNVYLNPRLSWMSREAIVGALLLPCALAATFGVAAAAALAAMLAVAFVYAQARMLNAAKGIPAWRTPQLVPLVVGTGLAEGGGLFLLFSSLLGSGSLALTLLAALLIGARWILWRRYRARLVAAPRAVAALDAAAGWLRWIGTLAPLALIGLAVTLALGGVDRIDAGVPGVAAALAGIGALLAGAGLKLTLITRAAFNQGFALSHLPVRGVRAQPR